MNKLLAAAVLWFVCICSVKAQSVVVEDLLYSVVEGTDYVSVKADSRDVVTANILSEVEIEGKAYKVRIIDVNAFSECEGLTSIVIPDGVTKIENGAFTLCKKLTSIAFPESMESIGEYAFHYCYGLTSIVIPQGLKSIKGSAFAGCTILESIVVADGNPVMDSRNNCNAVIETKSNTLIVGCKTTRIPDDVVAIGDYSFMHHPISSISLPDNLKSIGSCAFSESNINFVVVPSSVTSVAPDAFQRCDSLNSIVVEDGNAVYDSRNDCNAIIETKTNTLLLGCRATTIPSTVTAIGTEAFASCNMESMAIPESVTYIGENAFAHCKNLTIVVLPENLKTVGRSAFWGCDKLYSITLKGKTPPVLAPDKYLCDYEYTTLVVPVGTKPAYEVAEVWKNFKTIREAGDLSDGLYFEKNDIFYRIVSAEEKTVEVTFRGMNYNDHYNDYRQAIVVVPHTVNFEDVELTVIGVSEYAFYGCNVFSVTLPKNVQYVGDRAFASCQFLSSVILPDGVQNVGEEIFYGSAIQCVTLPASVVTIGESAFCNCPEFKQLVMKGTVPPKAYENSFDAYDRIVLRVPAGAYSDYQNASVWRNFSNIKEKTDELADGGRFEKDGIYYRITSAADRTVEVTYNGEEYSDFENEYTGDVVIPQVVSYQNTDFTVAGIGDHAFYDCYYIYSVTLPETVAYIGEYAFCGCMQMTSAKMPDNITAIGQYAFNYCINWENPVLPKRLEKIGLGAFVNCRKLKTLHIPASVVEIGNRSFANCSNLESITVEPGNPVYSCPDNCNAVVENGYWLILGCKNTVIPDGVQGIASGAFYGCADLIFMEIPESVKEIQYYVFDDCVNLKCLKLNNPVPASLDSESFADELYADVLLILPSGASLSYGSAEGWSNFGNTMETVGGHEAEVDNVAGLLKHIIEEPGIVTSLTMSGELNGTDISFVRSLPSLERLDISNATIVAGGEEYADGKHAETGVIGAGMFTNDLGLRWLSLPRLCLAVEDGAVSSELVRELHWNCDVSFRKSVFMNPDVATNMILYINADAACDYDINVVRNGMAEEVVLMDSLPLRITTGFTAKKISYTRHFDKVTVPHEPGGWESIVLPFDVQSFWSEEAGEIAPFNSGNVGARPFMLAQMTGNGFAVATEMKANVPYILVMPNSEAYYDRDNISGRVTFSAESKIGVLVAPTTDAEMSMGKEFDLVPTYDDVAQNLSVYALNDKSYDDMLPGSAFVSGLRMVKPFEAYASVESKPANAKTHFVIGGNGTATDIQRLYDRLFEGLEVESRDGVLYIHSSETQNVGIYSSDGRLVRIMRLNEGVNTVTGLAKGVYMVGKKKVAVK